MTKTILSLFVVTSLVFGLGAIETSKATPLQPKAPQAADFRHEKVLSKTTCSTGTNHFELYLTSPTGNTLEDDTTLWIVNCGSLNADPIKSGDISLLPPISSSNSVCKAAAAFEVADGKIVIPISVSNRPDLDSLAVVIYDTNLKKVLKYSVIRQYYAELPKIREIKGGFSFLAISAQADDSPKGMVETWMNITWDGNNILTSWDTSRKQIRHTH